MSNLLRVHTSCGYNWVPGQVFAYSTFEHTWITLHSRIPTGLHTGAWSLNVDYHWTRIASLSSARVRHQSSLCRVVNKSCRQISCFLFSYFTGQCCQIHFLNPNAATQIESSPRLGRRFTRSKMNLSKSVLNSFQSLQKYRNLQKDSSVA